MLSQSYSGTLSLSFILMGRLNLGVDLSGASDSREINEFMELLKNRRVRVTVEEVAYDL